MDEVHKVTFVPCIEVEVVVVRRLAEFPTVKQLVHDHKTHAVAKIEQLWSWRVVRGANGIAAHRTKNLQLPLGGPLVERRTQRSEVVMVAHALDSQYAVIEQKTLFGTPRDLADAERRLHAIHFLAIREERRPQGV